MTIAYALLGGMLPALIWLIFWLREDKIHPEPNGIIVRTFLLGMLAVIAVLPFQKAVESFFPQMIFVSIILWAVLEEAFKFAAGWFGGLHSSEDNEPVDPLIYMITAALGFVALENALFILGPLLNENVTQSVITGNLRFLGASLLHVVSSGIVGATLAFSFYQNRRSKLSHMLWGFAGAVVFHVIFNILVLGGGGGATFAFGGVWLGAIALLLAFERAKSIARQNR